MHDDRGSQATVLATAKGPYNVSAAPLEVGLDRIIGSLRIAIEATPSATLRTICNGFEKLKVRRDRPVRIAIIGEANSGKTTLANGLIGAPLLPTSVVANTPYPVRVRYADLPRVIARHESGKVRTPSAAGGALPRTSAPPEPANAAAAPFGHETADDPVIALEIEAPIEALEGLELIDTPAITDDGAPESAVDADIWIWCTNASRAWGCSEKKSRQDFYAMRPGRSILVATHADTLASQRDCQRVLTRLDAEAGAAFARIAFASHARHLSDAGAISEGLEAAIAMTRRIRERRLRTISRLATRLARLSLKALESTSLSSAAYGCALGETRSALEELVAQGTAGFVPARASHLPPPLPATVPRTRADVA